MHRIRHARANPDFSLDLRFDDDREARVDLSDFVNSAVIATRFRDPKLFVSELKLIEDGDVLHWDDQFELHADSLRYRAFADEFIRDYGSVLADEGRPAA